MTNKLTKASLLLSALFAAQAMAGIKATVTLDKSSFRASEDVVVRLTFSNPDSTPQKLLKWYTPAGGVKENLFSITAGNESAEYTGIHIKRPAPTAADYLTLQPGQSVSYKVELTSLYDLPVSGNYEIRYQVETAGLHNPALFNTAQVGTNLPAAPTSELKSEAAFAQIDVDARLKANVERPMLQTMAGSVSYSANCSASQKSTIATAFASAKTYASGAYSYLTSYPSATRANSTRYKTWFGTYSSGNWSTATSHYNNISSALNNQAVVFDCGCTDSYYAYVYPNQPYKIYVCSAFWSAPNTGTDSKAGTIVHETSHFTVVAATDDLAYGQTAAKSLAKSSPTKALKNADSHEYFAENTPAQN
jgi:peptidyl-Lys metalloendopeptidase